MQRSREALPERSSFEWESGTSSVEKCNSFDAVNPCVVPRGHGAITNIGHYDLCNEWVFKPSQLHNIDIRVCIAGPEEGPHAAIAEWTGSSLGMLTPQSRKSEVTEGCPRAARQPVPLP